MSQQDDLYTALKNADAAGDVEGARKLAAYIQSMPQDQSRSVLDRTNADVTLDQARAKAVPESGLGRFVAGYGAGAPRLARGIGQRAGVVSQADVDEANARDKPLLSTWEGGIGNMLGSAATAIPSMFVPGAGQLGGAAMIAGVLGKMQPTSTGESSDKNAAIGMVAGPAGILGGRAVGAAYQGGKALLEPLYEAGQNRIAGRMIQKFADDPSAIAGATNVPTVTGAVPTLAEQTGDRGLARLQDALRVTPAGDRQIGARLGENNAARVNALRTLAGEDGARDFAVANRSGTAGPMYQDAFNVVPDAAGMTPAQSRTMATLMKAPAIKSALADARAIGANNGTNVGQSNATGSIEGLHNMKVALDDAIQTATNAGQSAKADSIREAQKKLVSLIEDISPDYKAARVTYAQMSKPINAMDTAALLARKGLSNGSDLSGNPTINRNALMGALRDEPALVRQATGRNLGGLDKVMEPQDLATLRAIAAEADRAGAVATAGNGPGSATAQRFATQNLLKQTLGPLGLPEGLADSTALHTLTKPLNLLYGNVAEPKIQQALVDAMLDPMKAKALLAASSPAQRSALVQLFQRTAAARAVPAANGLANGLANRP